MGKKVEEFDTERFFAALSDRTRLRLLNLMNDQEVCVCFFVETLKEHQPKISRHLAYLRDAGIVSGRKDGKWMHYRIIKPANPHAEKILMGVLLWIKDDPEMQRERAKFLKYCCTPATSTKLLGVPRPSSPAGEIWAIFNGGTFSIDEG